MPATVLQKSTVTGMDGRRWERSSMWRAFEGALSRP